MTLNRPRFRIDFHKVLIKKDFFHGCSCAATARAGRSDSPLRTRSRQGGLFSRKWITSATYKISILQYKISITARTIGNKRRHNAVILQSLPYNAGFF
jgi:hypothetical protein